MIIPALLEIGHKSRKISVLAQLLTQKRIIGEALNFLTVQLLVHDGIELDIIVRHQKRLHAGSSVNQAMLFEHVEELRVNFDKAVLVLDIGQIVKIICIFVEEGQTACVNARSDTATTLLRGTPRGVLIVGVINRMLALQLVCERFELRLNFGRSSFPLLTNNFC